LLEADRIDQRDNACRHAFSVVLHVASEQTLDLRRAPYVCEIGADVSEHMPLGFESNRVETRNEERFRLGPGEEADFAGWMDTLFGNRRQQTAIAIETDGIT